VDFDFGVEGPDPERFEPDRFAIRWTGSIAPPETGTYEFVVRTGHSARLALNTAWYELSLIDAFVKSGDGTENRASVFLLGGRSYPLRVEFSKSNQGVDKDRRGPSVNTSVSLLWKPPQGVLEPVPARCLSPQDAAQVFVLTTPFPPDDKSIGYERGSTVSAEWFAAATAASAKTADYVLDHVEHLARVKRDTPDLDTGLKRSLLLTLGSPRFLLREAASGVNDAFATAARLSFGLWDSIPDEPLWARAAKDQLATPEQVRAQAERMVNDRRTRAKVRDFLFAWLRIDQGREIVKDKAGFPEFSPEIAADMRTSLELFLDDVVWGQSGSDFRRLFTDEDVYVNGRLAPLYGAKLAAEAPFQRIRLDDGRRAGVLSHPYMASVLSYAGATSPIHRGVFLARSVMGNVLEPPQEAVAPLPPDLHADLSTRERVSLQTSAVACQTCHTMINPLGFALEECDPIGRYRTTEKRGATAKPIDASGAYLPREGPKAVFRGAWELAATIAGSRDAQDAFVQNLFHALVKQPARAWGPDTLEKLRQAFVANDCDIRRLGVGSGVLPFLGNLPSLAAAGATAPKKRLVIVFSPDGVVKKNFWPAEAGPFTTRPPDSARWNSGCSSSTGPTPGRAWSTPAPTARWRRSTIPTRCSIGSMGNGRIERACRACSTRSARTSPRCRRRCRRRTDGSWRSMLRSSAHSSRTSPATRRRRPMPCRRSSRASSSRTTRCRRSAGCRSS
jgi:hypothetical protein